jgi:hypothetical protein
METIKWKNGIHVIEHTLTPYPRTHQKIQTSCSQNLNINFAVQLFLNCIKKQMWLENYETCRDVMTSYGEAVIKI